jgi:hypothetical protein
MKPEQALDFLDKVAALRTLNRQEHLKIQEAIVSTQKASGTEVSSGCYYSVMVRRLRPWYTAA